MGRGTRMNRAQATVESLSLEGITHAFGLPGVFHNNPDFAAHACLLGGHGGRVSRESGLAPALERALAAGRPAVVDVIQDRMAGLPPGLSPPGASRG